MRKKIQCYSGIGGQAVLEGVMMKNEDRYAVAIRRQNGEIVVEKGIHRSAAEKVKHIPFLRGILIFLDSMTLGMKVMNISSSYYEEEEEEKEEAEKEEKETKWQKLRMGMTLLLSLSFAVLLFMLLPYFLAEFLSGLLGNGSWLPLMEGVLRIMIFLGYMTAIAAMKDIRRLYQYHGAEHKCISCIENGLELTAENAAQSSRFHKRCGTSFILITLMLSILVFMFIRTDHYLLRVLLRLALLPFISGISYELIRLAGRSDNVLIDMISAPGLWMQRLTTREPDREMLETAIAAVNAVYDWKGYLKQNFPHKYKEASERKNMETEG